MPDTAPESELDLDLPVTARPGAAVDEDEKTVEVSVVTNLNTHEFHAVLHEGEDAEYAVHLTRDPTAVRESDVEDLLLVAALNGVTLKIGA